MEGTLNIHKNDIVYTDPKTRNLYRLDNTNIKGITYDYREVKKFFGLKKELIEVIIIVTDQEATELDAPIEIRSDIDPEFRRYMAKVRTFCEDNKVPLEIRRFDGDNTKIN